jgi:hypothetical protein
VVRYKERSFPRGGFGLTTAAYARDSPRSVRSAAALRLAPKILQLDYKLGSIEQKTPK